MSLCSAPDAQERAGPGGAVELPAGGGAAAPLQRLRARAHHARQLRLALPLHAGRRAARAAVPRGGLHTDALRAGARISMTCIIHEFMSHDS